MMNQPIVHLSIQAVWSFVENGRHAIAEALQAYPDAIRAAAVVSAAELLENAVKYGECVPAAPKVSITLRETNGCLQIETVNGSTSLENVKRLQAHIERLKNTEDRMSLWVERVLTLCHHPRPDSGLGLYRVALEGGFELECLYEQHVVTVVAVRSIS